MDGRLSITDVAKAVGVTPRTIMRWEKAGKIQRSKRDWRGWRFYMTEDLEGIKRFYESSYEYGQASNGTNGAGQERDSAKATVAAMVAFALIATSIICTPAFAQLEAVKSNAVTESATSVDIDLAKLPVRQEPPTIVTESTKYTLGPDDVINIDVRRHPEFSGDYKVNSEGKIEYKFVGDLVVNGMTKAQLQEQLTRTLAEYLVEPEVNVTIIQYLSKVFYVVGEVGNPGKFYMKGNAISVREALMDAGLPTIAASMRRCRLISPTPRGNKYRDVNVYELLYGGRLEQNLEMQPGDVLYIPATIMAKIIRVIAPVTDTAARTAGTAATAAAVVAL